MKTCLLVIDVQQSFLHRDYFSPGGMVEYLAAQNLLVAGAAEAGWPMVRVFHHEPAADAGDPFGLASGLVRPLEGLTGFDPALTVHKTRHSALVGTGLDVWLVEQGVRRIVVSGIRTEQCCETTARHASDLGWTVDFVTKATMTWDIASAPGGRLGADDIRARTAAVLHRRFARVTDVEGALHGTA